MIILLSAMPSRVHIYINSCFHWPVGFFYRFEFDTLQAVLARIIHWAYYNTFQTTWIISRLKKKIQYSPPVFFILHANVVCMLLWFFLVCFYFSREISRHYIPDKNTVQPTRVFSFARSRFLVFLVFPREMVWLYIPVRLIYSHFIKKNNNKPQ